MKGDALSAAAAEIFAPLLKDEGFRKRRLTWNRSERGITSVVNIQRSQWGSRDQCVFMVNLATGFQPDEPDRFLMEYDCPWFLRRRLSEDLSGARGKDWTIDPNTLENARVVVRESRDDLFNFGLPWLASLRTPARLIESLREEIAIRNTRGAKRWIMEANEAIERAQAMIGQADDPQI